MYAWVERQKVALSVFIIRKLRLFKSANNYVFPNLHFEKSLTGNLQILDEQQQVLLDKAMLSC